MFQRGPLASAAEPLPHPELPVQGARAHSESSIGPFPTPHGGQLSPLECAPLGPWVVRGLLGAGVQGEGCGWGLDVQAAVSRGADGALETQAELRYRQNWGGAGGGDPGLLPLHSGA